MGPLTGYRIIELAGLGPGPFCGMMLADMGATVIRVDRPDADPRQRLDTLCRNRKSIALDLKTEQSLDVLLRLVDGADALFEGFRPGVAERLGFGPEVCLARNPRLVYGRVTGWGQSGPLAPSAGHDIDYIALSGALHAIGRAGERPVPPLNLLGDYGGGGLLLAYGMVCALLEASRSGRGQVVDAAMVDGAVALMAIFYSFRAMGLYDGQTGTHFLSGAAHFYDTYETADGKYVAVGSLEPQFYEQMITIAGVDRERFLAGAFRLEPGAMDPARWADLKSELGAAFRRRSRDEWCKLFEGTDCCVAPVLTTDEASRHPHNVARRNFIEVDGVLQHAPAPRFDRTATGEPSPPPLPGQHSREVLREAGYRDAEIADLLASGTVVAADS
jgi:alpha-methylacyl-CoA racemase